MIMKHMMYDVMKSESPTYLGVKVQDIGTFQPVNN